MKIGNFSPFTVAVLLIRMVKVCQRNEIYPLKKTTVENELVSYDGRTTSSTKKLIRGSFASEVSPTNSLDAHPSNVFKRH